MRLVEALALAKPEADRLLAAAGLGAARPPPDWQSEAFAGVRHIIGLMLARHDPFPGLLCDRAATILHTNRGFADVLGFAGLRLAAAPYPPNLYDLTLHPEGIIRHLINTDEVVPHTLHRLRLAAAQHHGAAQTLARVLRYPSAQLGRFSPHSGSVGGVISEHYRVGVQDIRIVSTTSTFGSPEDETAQHIQIEFFFPADEGTQALFEGFTVANALGDSGNR
jgi:MmyB-like transcription regulator ligand binding domain